LPERWEPVQRSGAVVDRAWTGEPVLPSEQGQEPAEVSEPQWFEQVQRRRGIELRKPFP